MDKKKFVAYLEILKTVTVQIQEEYSSNKNFLMANGAETVIDRIMAKVATGEFDT